MENERKKLALEIIDRLKKEYPEAGCTLDYNEAWKLWSVSGWRPSAQTPGSTW